MDINEILENLDNHCVRLDWKAEMADAIYCMKNSWSHLLPVLQNENFISLIENYDSETPIDYLPALGQELSVHGLALYNMDEGNDEYCLLIIPKENLQEFEKVAKNKKLKVQLQLQQRKKFGDPAKRLNLANQIQSEKILVKGDLNLTWPISFCQERHYTKEGGYSGVTFTLLDIKTWPPTFHPSSEITRLAYSEKHNLWAAIFLNREDKNTTLKINSSPLDVNGWKEIPFPEGNLYPLCKLYWIDEDLVMLHEKSAWLVQSAAIGFFNCKKIMEATNVRRLTLGTFPNVFKTGNGQIYILLHERFYAWQNHQLVPTGFFPMEHIDFNTFPTGKNRFVYMAKDQLIEMDLTSGKTRSRTLPYLDNKTTVSPYSKEWAVFLRFGYTNKSLDIAQFWNYKTDTWLRMSLGALGKYGIRDILLHPDGYTLIDSGDKVLFKVDQLLHQLETQRKKTHVVPDWSENWSEDF